jgi:hypothetical protein
LLLDKYEGNKMSDNGIHPENVQTSAGVWCDECKKVYSVADMKLTYTIMGNWGYKNHQCPLMHSLALIKEIHLMRFRK